LNLSTTKVAGFWEPGLLRFIDSCFIGPRLPWGKVLPGLHRLSSQSLRFIFRSV